MHKTVKPIAWQFDKFGHNLKPWVVQLKLKNEVNGADGQFTTETDKNLRFKFTMRN